MDLTRRFVFRGNASALGGQIFRPKTFIVDLDGASSIGVSGGRSRAEIKGRSFGDFIRFESAMTLAEGLFDDEKAASAVTDHKGRQDDLRTTTTVTAEMRGLSIGRAPGVIFTTKRIRATLVSRKPDNSGEPSIAPARDTTLQGIDISGRPLEITLNAGLFQKYDTRSKLLAAVDDAKFVRSFGQQLVTGATIDGHPRRPGLVRRDGVIYTTIVEKIVWKGKPYPGATIDGHTVRVPDFGTIYFGELLIASLERRLTMVRLELGSPDGGYVDSGDVGSNGSAYP
jgi:hypothetical protein